MTGLQAAFKLRLAGSPESVSVDSDSESPTLPIAIVFYFTRVIAEEVIADEEVDEESKPWHERASLHQKQLAGTATRNRLDGRQAVRKAGGLTYLCVDGSRSQHSATPEPASAPGALPSRSSPLPPSLNSQRRRRLGWAASTEKTEAMVAKWGAAVSEGFKLAGADTDSEAEAKAGDGAEGYGEAGADTEAEAERSEAEAVAKAEAGAQRRGGHVRPNTNAETDGGSSHSA